MKNKKVLFVHHGRGLGGSPTSLRLLVNELRNNSIDTEILCLSKSEAIPYFLDENIKVYSGLSWYYENIHIPIAHSDANPISIFNPLKLTYQICSFLASGLIFAPLLMRHFSGKYDVIYLNSISLIDFLLISKFFAPKVYIHCREPLSRGAFGLRKWLLTFTMSNFANKVLCSSDNYFERLNLKNKILLRNFTPKPSFDCPSIDKCAPSVCFMGGTSDLKGFSMLLKLLPLISPDIQINVLGYINFVRVVKVRLPSGNEILSSVSDLPNYFPNLQFIGPISDPIKYIASSRLLLNLFTRPHFSRPIIEAFSCRRIVIANNIDGIHEQISHNHDGYILNVPDHIAQHINSLVFDTRILTKMGNVAFESWALKYSPLNIQVLLDSIL